MKKLLIGLLVFTTAAFVSACSSNELTVEDAWARPGNANMMSAAYFVVTNPSDQADALLSAETDVTEHVEMHLSKMKDDGTMTMIQQDSIPVPSGDKVELKPGGLHLMLINLNQDLTPGDKFALHLTFEKAGSHPVEVVVREP